MQVRYFYLVFFIYFCMKKTRFFYGMNYFLIVVLGWLLLFGKAAEVNQGKRESVEASAEEKKVGYGTNGGEKGEDGQAENRQEASRHGSLGANKNVWSVGVVGAAVGLACKSMQTAEADNISEPSIRVLITDSSWQSCYHTFITIEQNGQKHTYTQDSPELQKAPLLLEGGEEGIAVLSISRAQNPPVYYGALEIKRTDQGLLLINQLPLEKYLEAVVPSEMPSSYEEQALMAQAVCARTYAVCQMKEKSLWEEFGADVDDSVNYQVYGNFRGDKNTSQAVKKTRGQILCQDGEPITAYYFSTSAGQTSTDEIWGAGKAASYLKSVECGFDQEAPWSSWSVEIPWERIEESAKNRWANGGLKSLQAVKKNASGAVTGLEIDMEEGSALLEGEYEIREFLSPEGLIITEKDGSQTKGGSLLPSAYFDLAIEQGALVHIQGKGYGHGVGMSQNGANEMAKEGYIWQEILNYFFRDVTIESLE